MNYTYEFVTFTKSYFFKYLIKLGTGKTWRLILSLIKLQARPATLLKKRLWHRCFPVNFSEISKNTFFKEHLWWLLLQGCGSYIMLKFSALNEVEIIEGDDPWHYFTFLMTSSKSNNTHWKNTGHVIICQGTSLVQVLVSHHIRIVRFMESCRPLPPPPPHSNKLLEVY